MELALGSFNKAGQRLNLSPPEVFAQIHQLEAELGEELYDRAGRKLVLTPAGRLTLEYCRRLLLVNDEAVAAVRQLNGVERGSLYLGLGCGPHISVSIVPHLLRLITGSDQTLFEDLYARKVGIILMNLPVDEPELVQDPLWPHNFRRRAFRASIYFVSAFRGHRIGHPAVLCGGWFRAEGSDAERLGGFDQGAG